MNSHSIRNLLLLLCSSGLLACSGAEESSGFDPAACEGADTCGDRLVVEASDLPDLPTEGKLTVCYTYYSEKHPCAWFSIAEGSDGLYCSYTSEGTTCERMPSGHLALGMNLDAHPKELTGVLTGFQYENYADPERTPGFGAERPAGLFEIYPEECGATCREARALIQLDTHLPP